MATGVPCSGHCLSKKQIVLTIVFLILTGVVIGYAIHPYSQKSACVNLEEQIRRAVYIPQLNALLRQHRRICFPVDPGGQAVQKPVGGAFPPTGMTDVQLRLMVVANATPDVPGAPGDCRTLTTRPSGTWKGAPTPSSHQISVAVPVPLAMVTPVAGQVSSNPMTPLTALGNYGWITGAGCYYVEVWPPNSPLTGTPLSISPLVGESGSAADQVVDLVVCRSGTAFDWGVLRDACP